MWVLQMSMLVNNTYIDNGPEHNKERTNILSLVINYAASVNGFI